MRPIQHTFTTICLCAVLLSPTADAQAQNPAKTVEGQLQLENVPAVSRTDQDALRPYIEARTGVVFGWHPEGNGIVIGTRFGNTQQLHELKKPMGARTQITFEEEPINFAIVNNNVSTPMLIFAKDTGGDEQTQLIAQSLFDGTRTLLTEGPNTRNESAVFARDGLRFAYTRTDASGKYQVRMGSIEQPSKTSSCKMFCQGKTKSVFEAPGTWYVMDIHPTQEKILLQQYRSILDSDLVEVNLKTGKKTNIPIDKKPAAMGSARYSLDGKLIHFLSDNGGQYSQLMRHVQGSTRSSVISPKVALFGADIEEYSFNADESMVALNVNQNGNSELMVFSLYGEAKPLARVASNPGVISGIEFHASENRVLLSLSSSQSPGDAYVFNVSDSILTRWTQHELGGLRDSQMFLPERITFVSNEGTPKAHGIQAFVYRPEGDGPHPSLLIVHGGPEAQVRPGFDAWVQYLVRELKIAVILPNVRGSTGYGRTFTQMDDGVKRAEAVADLGGLLDWIAKQKELDTKRVAIMGGSYGGFMTLAALVQYPDRFKAGINIVGVSDFTTFLKNTSNYRRDLRRAEYGDERKPEIAKFFDSISPLKNASKITAPLFVIQGFNDPRVPESEARQIATAVRNNGQAVWTMTAMDEGHGFKKKANIERMRLAMIAFLRAHLLDGPHDENGSK
jgi:dipeptidyl aminopeptidase/acylaminoacyl peptidase